MRATIRRGSAAARGTLEHERCLINAAIALLASGGAIRVTITGLRFGERILPTAEISARKKGVVLRPLWRPGGTICDIAVEPRV
jgi:hypothetical protein